MIYDSQLHKTDEILDETDHDERVRLGLQLPSEESFDYNRLRLIDPGLGLEPLTLQELDTLAIYLSACIPFHEHKLPDGSPAGEGVVRWMLENSEVIVQERETPMGVVLGVKDDDFLFRVEQNSSRCIVILSGKVRVISGRDQFRFEASTYAVLGGDIFSDGDDYKADFSAYIMSEKVRYVTISYLQFRRIITGDISQSHIPRSRSSYGLDFTRGPSGHRMRSQSTAPGMGGLVPSAAAQPKRSMSANPGHRGERVNGTLLNVKSEPSVESVSQPLQPVWVPRSASSGSKDFTMRSGRRSASPESGASDLDLLERLGHQL